MTNDVRAKSEGWALFETDRGVEILTLDDPPNSRPLNCKCDIAHEHAGTCCQACRAEGYQQIAPDKPVFACDGDALAFVRARAAEGSAFHQDALNRITVQTGYAVLDTYRAQLCNEYPPRVEEVTEIQDRDSGVLLCYAAPEKAEEIIEAVNAHNELRAACQFLLNYYDNKTADDVHLEHVISAVRRAIK